MPSGNPNTARLRDDYQPDTRSGWRERAACRGADVDLFFPTRADCAPAYHAALYCQACPVTADCLQEAIDHDRTSGVFGGHHFNDGRHRPIPSPQAADPGRSELARRRRVEAYAAYVGLTGDGLSPGAARRLLAARFGVTPTSVRRWIQQTQADEE